MRAALAAVARMVDETPRAAKREATSVMEMRWLGAYHGMKRTSREASASAMGLFKKKIICIVFRCVGYLVVSKLYIVLENEVRR